MLTMILARNSYLGITMMTLSTPTRVHHFIRENKDTSKCGYDRPVYLDNKNCVRVINLPMYNSCSNNTFLLMLERTPENVYND